MASEITCFVSIDGKYFETKAQAEEYELSLSAKIKQNYSVLQTDNYFSKLVKLYKDTDKSIWEIKISDTDITIKSIDGNVNHLQTLYFQGTFSDLKYWLCMRDDTVVGTHSRIRSIKDISDIFYTTKFPLEFKQWLENKA